MSNKEIEQKSKLEADDASSFPIPSETPDKASAEVEGAAVADSEANNLDSDNTKAQLDPQLGEKDESMKNVAEPSEVTQANNPLHGVKLQMIVEDLEAQYGWEGLAYRIDIKCFKSDPSVKSSLKFLRRTPWAREKVERLYLKTFHKKYRPESY